MIKLVALEGVDGVGKSTAVASLRQHHGAVCTASLPGEYLVLKGFIDTEASQLSKFLFYLSALSEVLSKMPKKNTILPYVCFDRYLPSLFAYNHVFSELSAKSFMHLLEPFWDYIPKESAMVLLTADRSCVARRLAKKSSKNSIENAILKDLSLVDALQDAYHSYFEMTAPIANSRFVEIDVTAMSPIEISTFIYKELSAL